MDLLIAVVAAAFSSLCYAPSLVNGQETWKQYRSVRARFRIEYPSDWKVTEQSLDSYEKFGPPDSSRNWTGSTKNKQRLVRFSSPEIPYADTFYGVAIIICSTPSAFRFIHSTCKVRDADFSDLYKDQVVSRRRFVLRGMKIERIETKSTYKPEFYYYARISYNGRQAFVAGWFTKHLDLDRYAPVFDKMLASFRPFLKSLTRTKPSIMLR